MNMPLMDRHNRWMHKGEIHFCNECGSAYIFSELHPHQRDVHRAMQPGDIKCNICATVNNPGEGDQTCRVCRKVLIGNAEGAGVGDGHGHGDGEDQGQGHGEDQGQGHGEDDGDEEGEDDGDEEGEDEDAAEDGNIEEAKDGNIEDAAMDGKIEDAAEDGNIEDAAEDGRGGLCGGGG